MAPRRRLHREQVLDALWPDAPPDEAARRLHKAAHFARRTLGPQGLRLRGETAALFPDDEVSIDVHRFLELAHEALASGDVSAAAVTADGYPGTLLPDDLYEDWTQEHRHRLELLYVRLLRQAQHWERLVELDPTDEPAHLAIMRRHAAQGDRRSALRQYERLSRALQRGLGVGPNEAATALRDSLLASSAESAASATPTILVGRQTQTQQLERALAEAAAGRGRTVFLSGAAGMGKSFLANWLRDRAVSQGWRAGVSVASTVEGAGSHAPVLDAVADLCRRHPTLLDGLDDRCRLDIELALSGRYPDDGGEPGHQRLYVALADLMRLAAAGAGALIAVDNLHEADEASLRLLHYLARSCLEDRFLLLLCYRRQAVSEAFEQVRSSLLARGMAVDIPVPPLSRQQTAALVGALAPDLDGGAIERIWDFSGGLPFAVVEAARLPRQSGGSGRSPGAVVLDVLEPRVRTVLEHVAVSGSVFDTDEFVALSGASEHEAYDCLDAALAALVIERTATGYRFRHPLIRESLLEAVPPHRQRMLHRACATRLAGLGVAPSRIGHHLLAAGDTGAAVPYVLREAESAAAIGAYRDALALVESVRAVVTGTDRTRTLALRADLLAATGDPTAVSAYHDAIEAAPPRARHLLRAALGRLPGADGLPPPTRNDSTAGRHVLERDHELSVLAAAAQEAADGTGCVVLVSGEAGIGKSSLVEAIGERLPARIRLLIGYCDDLATRRTMGPFRDLVGSVGIDLTRALKESGDRDRVLAALHAELDQPRRPAILAIEDIHWADDATLDALRFLIRRMVGLPAVLLLTYRDDELTRERAGLH